MIPFTSPWNTLIFPVRKPKGQGWRFIQDRRTINSIIIPQHPAVPNPHTLLTSIPTGSKFFTVIDLHSVFFSIPADEASQYLFAFTWEEKQFTWTVMPKGYTKSPYFLQILKAELDDIKFPTVLLWYIMWMICLFALLLKPPHRKTPSTC